MFAEGRTMKEIAGLLDLSEKTVEFHKHHVMVSFNIKNNAQLILFALKHGLISVDPEPFALAPVEHPYDGDLSTIADEWLGISPVANHVHTT